MLRVKRKGSLEYFVGRRYGDFSKLHKALRQEIPGKVLPPMPKKNKQNSTTRNLIDGIRGKDDDYDDASSVSSQSTTQTGFGDKMKNLSVKNSKGSRKWMTISKLANPDRSPPFDIGRFDGEGVDRHERKLSSRNTRPATGELQPAGGTKLTR